MSKASGFSALLRAGIYSAKDPYVLYEFLRKVARRLKVLGHQTSDADSAEVVAWCREHIRSAEEALRQIPGAGEDVAPLEGRFPNEMAEARERASRCPMPLGGAGNMDFLFALCEHVQAMRVVETGVAYGWSTLAILLSLRYRPAARLFSVDMPYLLLQNDEWVGVAVPEDLRGQWQLQRTTDRKGLPRILNIAGPVDLAHYDSDKSYAGRMWAYDLLWTALRAGGVLMSDDVGDNAAFRDFALQVGAPPIILTGDGNKYQGVIVKP